MTGEIVSLKGLPIKGELKSDPYVIAELEDMLDLAKSGKLVGIAVALEYFDAETGQRKVGVVSHAMIGRMEFLKARILEDLHPPQ